MGFLTLIDELQEYIESASNMPLSSRCIVDKVEVIETIKEIKKMLPKEMRKAEWIIKEQERIIKEAQDEAQNVHIKSERQLKKLLADNDIVKQAQTQAAKTLKDMKLKKTEINKEIREYADYILEELQAKLESELEKIKSDRADIKSKALRKDTQT